MSRAANASWGTRSPSGSAGVYSGASSVASVTAERSARPERVAPASLAGRPLAPNAATAS